MESAEPQTSVAPMIWTSTGGHVVHSWIERDEYEDCVVVMDVETGAAYLSPFTVHTNHFTGRKYALLRTFDPDMGRICDFTTDLSTMEEMAVAQFFAWEWDGESIEHAELSHERQPFWVDSLKEEVVV